MNVAESGSYKRIYVLFLFLGARFFSVPFLLAFGAVLLRAIMTFYFISFLVGIFDIQYCFTVDRWTEKQSTLALRYLCGQRKLLVLIPAIL